MWKSLGTWSYAVQIQVVLLFMLAMYCKCHMMLENPLGSLVSWHPIHIQMRMVWISWWELFSQELCHPKLFCRGLVQLVLGAKIHLHERLAAFIRAWGCFNLHIPGYVWGSQPQTDEVNQRRPIYPTLGQDSAVLWSLIRNGFLNFIAFSTQRKISISPSPAI